MTNQNCRFQEIMTALMWRIAWRAMRKGRETNEFINVIIQVKSNECLNKGTSNRDEGRGCRYEM